MQDGGAEGQQEVGIEGVLDGGTDTGAHEDNSDQHL